MTESLSRAWTAISEIGIRYALNDSARKMVRLQNRIAFISAMVVTLQSFSFFSLGLHYLLIVNAFVIAVYLSCLLFSATGHLLFARILFMTNAMFAITHHHLYFGFAAGFWVLSLALSQAVFVLFPEWSMRRLVLLSALLGLAIILVLVLSFGYPPLYSAMTAELAQKFMRGNVVRGPILLLIVAYYLVSENRRVEGALRFTANKATEAAEAKSFFLSNISHELRTPMNAIKGFADILLEDTASLGDEKKKDKFKTHLNQIRISAANLTSIIDDILDFARIENGGIRFRNRDFDLQELVGNVMQTAQFYGHQSHRLEIQTELTPGLPRTLKGDPVRLSQILLNILSNAMKFTHSGFVKLRISLRESTDVAHHMIFEVEDSGIGIPGEKLPFLFDSFSQVSRETAVRYGGTGLGLAISKHLVEMQGGTIAVMSSPGKGSLFTVNLWFDKGAAETTTDGKLARDLKKARILVAEDNEVNQMLIQSILEAWNADLHLVENGLAALGAIQKQPYDLVLMDLQMHFMDGFEATENIRMLDDKKRAMVPIVALTADVLSETRKRALAVGMNDLVTKPINQADLYAVLKKALGLPD